MFLRPLENRSATLAIWSSRCRLCEASRLRGVRRGGGREACQASGRRCGAEKCDGSAPAFAGNRSQTGAGEDGWACHASGSDWGGYFCARQVSVVYGHRQPRLLRSPVQRSGGPRSVLPRTAPEKVANLLEDRLGPPSHLRTEKPYSWRTPGESLKK